MKKIYTKLFLFPILVSLLSCNSSHNDKSIDTIDVKSNNSANISELFSSFRIIPLETNTKSLIGLNIERIEIYKNRIFVLNKLSSRRNILCFDLMGNFLFNIDKMGNAPGEYTYLGDFFIDILKKQLVLKSELGRILFFDIDGNYLYTEKQPEENFVRQHIYLNDSICIGYNDVDELPKGYNLIEFDAKYLKIKNKSNFLKEPFGWLGLPALARFNNAIYYYNINDTIYNVTNIQKPRKNYFVDFGNEIKKLKIELINKALSNKEEGKKNFRSSFNEKKIDIVNSFYINDKWVAVNIFKKGSKDAFINSVIFYNKSNKKTYTTSNINFNLFNLSQISNIKVVGSTENSLYILLNEFSKQEKENIRNSPKLSKKDKNALIHNTIDDNPILLEIK